MFVYKQLYDCYLKCRKNKRNTINQLIFEINAEQNLLRLKDELNNKTYNPSVSICFLVDKPKLREIFAAEFRDRIIHHVLVDHLENIIEPKFIYDNYACRKNKGTHNAVKRLQFFCRSITHNNSRTAYFLQLDIRSFFVTINKDILFNLVQKYTDDTDMIWLSEKIIYNDCTDNCKIIKGNGLIKHIPSHKTLFKQCKNKGIPIGNLTSQFFANVYLNELDQFVKHTLKIKYYLRYSDDVLILYWNRSQLENWKEKIITFLDQKLDLEINTKKTIIRPISNGIDYLGYIVRPFYILVRRRVINNLKQKIFNKTLNDQSYASYLGHFKHANAYRLKKHVKSLIKGGNFK